MYLKRKIDLFLESWFVNPDRKPLIVKGARQVGKTVGITNFANNHYENIVYINFVLEPQFKTILEGGFKVEEIIKRITRIDPKKRFVPKKTLLFFDEIQDLIDISTALKFIKLDGQYDCICSGSLLGINYNKITSMSVGFADEWEMHSLDFEEFLWALGYDDSLREYFLDNMIQCKPFSANEMNHFMDVFLDYTILGGMPEVVADYIKNGRSFEGSDQCQKRILSGYKVDITKYAEGLDRSRILSVYNHIPVQLAKENKKFQLSRVERNARFRDYHGTIEWLYDAGLINICYCINKLELPLKGNYDQTKYKLYSSDTGLLVSRLDSESQEDLRANKNLGIYKGGLYENIIGEALVKSGFELYYFRKGDSTLEIDFLLRSKNCIVPIEVKANNGNAKSLKTVLDSKLYPEITYGIKMANRNIGFLNSIYTFPYFLSFLLGAFLKNK